MSQSPQGQDPRPTAAGFGAGAKRVFGPMLAGLAIDALDLMTFGPIGIYTGVIVGGAAGWWLAPELGFPQRMRWLCAALTGLYCTIPLTGFLPLAAIVAGISRLFDAPLEETEGAADDALDPKGSIEAEYESQWEDPHSR
jgi:hypothetical protein